MSFAASLTAYGDLGTFVDLGCDAARDRPRRTRALAAAARSIWPDREVVLGAGNLAIFGVAPDAVARARIEEHLAAETAGCELRLRAVYDGDDLAEVAASLGFSEAALVARHASATYEVELLGFMPGFAYLGSPTFAYAIPRRAAPRARVPRGSLAVAASFTGVYPSASPGGWQLLGRVIDRAMFDVHRDPPSLLRAGDRVRFEVVEAGDVRESPRTPVSEARRGLRVLAAPALATVQDGGRPGLLAQGVCASGPLDRETFHAANEAVGNARDEAAIEVPLGRLEVEAHGAPVTVSVDGSAPRRLAEGERLRVDEDASAVRYLAVRGGVDVPVVLGSRSTSVSAGFGGLEGRPLRRGDVLAVGDRSARDASSGERHDTSLEGSLAIRPGPHEALFAPGSFEALLHGPWRIGPRGDRTGTRLEGPPALRHGTSLALPAPMARGAIQITTDGTPIVLGPDHPTTGGYPVLAVLSRGDRDARSLLARMRPGAEVSFSDGRERGCSRPSSPR